MKQEISTKLEYEKLIYETIEETQELIKQFPSMSIYRNILEQLKYIESIVITERRNPTKKEVEPVTLGSIAIKNFEYEFDPYARKLINVFGNFDDFEDLK